jgi:SAM-dependent methyltransferase
MSIWSNEQFAQQWNDTYGLDMSRAPIRPGIIYPLIAARICWPQRQQDGIRVVDFGCGNGNFIRAFKNRPFVEWLGIDNGEAILATARPLAGDTKVSFLNRDIGQEIPEVQLSPGFDHAISVFTLEEISLKRTSVYFKNMAGAVSEKAGCVHIFTQHPAFALQQDIISMTLNTLNDKFQGHEGYFDTKPTTYNLNILNREKGVEVKPEYYHKPLATILNSLIDVGLCLQEVLEIPEGVVDIKSLDLHKPKRGDFPRFLYLRAKPLELPSQ